MKKTELEGLNEAETRIRAVKHFEWGLFGCSIERIVSIIRDEPKCECGWPNTPPRRPCRVHGLMDYCTVRPK
jgi:hypothetical protein